MSDPEIQKAIENARKWSDRVDIIGKVIMITLIAVGFGCFMFMIAAVEKISALANYNAGYAKGKYEVMQEAAKVYAGEYTVDSQTGTTTWKWNVDKTK